MEYIELSYNTYNSTTVYLAVAIVLVFVLGISILSTILEAEVYYYRGFCDPRFLYDKPCNDTIVKMTTDKKKNAETFGNMNPRSLAETIPLYTYRSFYAFIESLSKLGLLIEKGVWYIVDRIINWFLSLKYV
jgi:hypothetical protein